jgi:nitroimidazol reductase NimA-like FMN-containing flavoprotein (pyridoxamine 5'-phosphate oxidase superfamily)
MTLSMSLTEREGFLAGVHVGLVSVEDPGHGPLTVPLWYAYTPGGAVTFMTDAQSRKALRLRAAGRCSLCVQSEVPPYAYVCVEGPVVEVEGSVDIEERRAMAVRYLGAEIGELYLTATEAEAAGNVVFRLAPEIWRTVDFAKQYGSGGVEPA